MFHLPKQPIVARYRYQGIEYVLFVFEKGVVTPEYDRGNGKIVMKVYDYQYHNLVGKIFTEKFTYVTQKETLLESFKSKHINFLTFVYDNLDDVGKLIKKCEVSLGNDEFTFRYNPNWKSASKFAYYKNGLFYKELFNSKSEFKEAIATFEKNMMKLSLSDKIEKVAISDEIEEKVRKRKNVTVKKTSSVTKKTNLFVNHGWAGLTSVKRKVQID